MRMPPSGFGHQIQKERKRGQWKERSALWIIRRGGKKPPRRRGGIEISPPHREKRILEERDRKGKKPKGDTEKKRKAQELAWESKMVPRNPRDEEGLKKWMGDQGEGEGWIFLSETTSPLWEIERGERVKVLGVF